MLELNVFDRQGREVAAVDALGHSEQILVLGRRMLVPLSHHEQELILRLDSTNPTFDGRLLLLAEGKPGDQSRSHQHWPMTTFFCRDIVADLGIVHTDFWDCFTGQ